MWFLVAVASLLFVAYLLFSKRQRKFWFASPSGSVPILGHAPAFADMKKLHHQFCTWSKEMGGKNFEISLLGQRVVVLDDIDTMLHVWKDRTVRPDKIGAGALFSDAMESVWPPHHRLNLVSSTGDDHRRLRKILGVCFSPLSIRRSQEAINTMTERLLHSYEELRGSSSSLELDHVEFAKQLNMLTLDVIYAICFGRDPRPFLEKDPELEKAFLGMMEAFGRRLTSVPPLWRYGIQFGQIKQDQKMFQRLVEFALDSTKLALQDPEISKQNSLIARVLEGEEAGKLSTNELTSQMILLQNAGFETTSGAIRWMLIGVASRPDVAARVREETKGELDSKGLPLPSAKFQEWKFVQATVSETLRLWPSFPLGMGETIESVSIGGVDLPSGTAMYSNLYGLQRRDDCFSHASKFRPERWLEPRDLSLFPVHRDDVFLAFGGGTRVCLGQNLARHEMITTLCALLHNYDLSLPSGIPESDYNFALIPCPGFTIKFTPRKK